MTIINYGDIEVKKSELNNPKSWSEGLEKYISAGRKKVSRSRITGWLYRLIRGPDVVTLPGDFLAKDVLKGAFDETKNLATVIKQYSEGVDLGSLSINKEVLDEYVKSFDDPKNLSLEDQSKIYADLLFREDLALTKDSVAGAYKKILTKLQGIARRHRVEFAFVLGNNDLKYELFKERYKDLKFDKVHFVDRTRKKVGRKWLAGFGGSPEYPGGRPGYTVLGDSGGLGGLVTNAYLDINEVNKAKKELMEQKGRIHALVVHKSFNKVDGKEFWGKNINVNPYMNGFIEVIDELVKHFDPGWILSGHWHDGVCFEKNGVEYNSAPERVGVKNGFIFPSQPISIEA